MKKYALLPVLGCLMLIAIGCPSNNTPSAPPAATATFTPPGATSTPSFTPTFTPSFTGVFTNTATHTPTETPSFTPTFTPSSTPTETPTFTATHTPTDTATFTTTFTATNTATNCFPGSIQTTYTFDTSIDCWRADAGTTIVTAVSLTAARAHGGTQSLQVAVNNSSAVTQNAQVQVTFSSPQNMAGAVISMWVYAEGTLKTLPDWNTAIQPFAQDPWTGNWQALGPQVPVSTWTNVSVTLGAGATTITQFGLQLTSVGPGAYGSIFIDDININLAPAPTATPTFTFTPSVGNSFYFDGGSIPAGWSANPGGGAVTLSNLMYLSPGFNASAGMAGVTVQWSAINQTVNVQYNYGAPTDWTALGLSGFRAMIKVNPLMCTGGGHQLYCQSGPTYTWENSSWTNQPAADTWIQLNWVPPFAAGGSSPVSVQQFGVQFATGSTSSNFNTDTVFVDNVELY